MYVQQKHFLIAKLFSRDALFCPLTVKKLSWCWQTRATPCYAVRQNLVKIRWCAAQLLRIVDFQNCGGPPSWIFIFSQFLWKIQICAYIFVVMQNFVKIGWCAAELLRIFDFQNGGRPPSWIWYDVIAEHPRLVFDGPNVLLKLHVDPVNILRDIASFTRAT